MSADQGCTVLCTRDREWSLEALSSEVDRLAQWLDAEGVRVLATILDNGAAWVVADAAAAQAHCVHVPLPLFFSPQQLAHALQATGADALLLPASAAAPWSQANAARPLTIGGEALVCLRWPATPTAMPNGTRKISFTSGSTGTPKGVCLRAEALHAVTEGVRLATAPLQLRRHLCALPLAVLLEDAAGLSVALAQRACCLVPPLRELGWSGSSGFDAACFDAAVRRHLPHSLIVLPQMLRAWALWLHQHGLRGPASLRLVAVGGAAVGARTIEAARSLGLPAYEGYGLSEGASVQTLNLPGADRVGSVGRALPHARIRVADDGELLIGGALFAGYLGDQAAPPAWWPSGDYGHIDAEGFVHVHGRKKHVLITAFGRNVSPEWVETALRQEPSVAQAAVFGDGEPALCAVLWPMRADLADADLQRAVDAANATLPDYARVQRWVRAADAFSADTGLATANGRPRRDAIWKRHAEALRDATTCSIS